MQGQRPQSATALFREFPQNGTSGDTQRVVAADNAGLLLVLCNSLWPLCWTIAPPERAPEGEGSAPPSPTGEAARGEVPEDPEDCRDEGRRKRERSLHACVRARVHVQCVHVRSVRVRCMHVRVKCAYLTPP